jgi:hypothetical protein
MKHLVFSAVMLASTMAHAGDIIRNYDVDGNYTGYSERETEAETASRTHFEYMMAVQQDEARKRCFQIWAKAPNAFCHY